MTLELPLGAAPADQPLAVSAVVAAAKEVLDAALRGLWVEGELSGIKRWPSSGIWYLTLKDKDTSLSCVVFRHEAAALGRVLRELADGQQVYVRGDLSVGRRRADLQLIVRQLLPRPEGGFFQIQFERARAALAKDGLLDEARKRPLPRFPRRIVVVTSREGAVWHDIVSVVRRRWPYVDLVLAPARVQGEAAAPELRRALALAGRLPDVDLVIIARGGGSLEDLWPFNDEQVARAVAACPVPIISAVGHETDVTLTDLVADLRAPTPSAAAEKAVPDVAAVRGSVASLEAALRRGVAGRLAGAAHRIERAGTRIDHALGRRLDRARGMAEQAARRMTAACAERAARAGGRADRLGAALEALSPLRVLGRGYAVARDERGGVLRSVGDFPAGRAFRLRVADGEVHAVAGDGA